MALPDYTFTEGWDKYGPTGTSLTSNSVSGEWDSISLPSGGSFTIQASLSGPGRCLRMTSGGSGGNTVVMTKSFGANFARIVGGYACTVAAKDSTHYPNMTLLDGGTQQIAIGWTTLGQVIVKRGGSSGTTLATSTETFTTGTAHFLEYDITFSTTVGIVKIWIDGVLTSISLTGANTSQSGNARASGVQLRMLALNANSGSGDFDHMYFWCYTAAGGSETPALTNPIIETSYTIGDETAEWIPGAAILGEPWDSGSTNAPGANQLALTMVTAEQDADISTIRLIPKATSATAKFKAVIYSDSGGTPDTLLATGTEVVGCTSGTVLSLPFASNYTTVNGTTYWIGYITDTSVVMATTNLAATGQKAANTYTSGPPASAPAMTTGQSRWAMWSVLVNPTSNWPQVQWSTEQNFNATNDRKYNYSSTVGDKDLYDFSPLSVVTPTIYTMAIKPWLKKGDTGARTVDIQVKSAGVSSSGSAAAAAPATAYQWFSSYYNLDPATSAAWTQAALEAAVGGPRIVS